LGLIFSHAHVQLNEEPLITREKLEELKKIASFQILDYENHPFKGLTKTQVKHKLGLMEPVGKSKVEIFYGDINPDIPDAFDSRTQWPNCIHEIRDQAQCGSCWAFAASEVLSDRFCIASQGKTDVILSPQDLVSCDSQDFGCEGGYIDKSWQYIQDTGLVSDKWCPYSSGTGDSGTCPPTPTCPTTGEEWKKFKVSEQGQITTIANAKQAIFTFGPIEAGFDVYSDFMSYQGGIYRRTSDSFMGGHAVKIIGWGKDTDGSEYWIVANSWNTGWGESGFFRIAFGECNFEQQLFAGIPALDLFLKHH